MFLSFPASSAAHTTDEGVFCGPRPEFHLCSYNKKDDDDKNNPDVILIKNLIAVNERLIILTPASNFARLNTCLECPIQLLEITESKGLEFTDILLVDFFCSLPTSDIKEWRMMLANEQEGDGDHYPHLEYQLKLLYVAITRACNRLIFIETKPSGTYYHLFIIILIIIIIIIIIITEIATRMFKFWTHPNRLVSSYKPDNETHELLTADESVKRGLDFVINSLDLDNNDKDEKNKKIVWLDKALYYFKRAKRTDLEKRVIIQQKLLEYHDNINKQHALEADKIEYEYKFINLIHDCMINHMYTDAIQSMVLLNDDSRYMNEMINKFKSILPTPV